MEKHVLYKQFVCFHFHFNLVIFFLVLVILSAKWHCVRPYITGGSLDGKYVFSQIHFHWGKSATEGSEHTIDNNQMPLEMHAIHFKASYLNQAEALRHSDGVICVAYLFQVYTCII